MPRHNNKSGKSIGQARTMVLEPLKMMRARHFHKEKAYETDETASDRMSEEDLSPGNTMRVVDPTEIDVDFLDDRPLPQIKDVLSKVDRICKRGDSVSSMLKAGQSDSEKKLKYVRGGSSFFSEKDGSFLLIMPETKKSNSGTRMRRGLNGSLRSVKRGMKQIWRNDAIEGRQIVCSPTAASF